MSEQVAPTPAIEEIAITVFATIRRVAHCAVCQRSQLDRVKVKVLDSPVVGETEVLGLDVAEVERGGEHRVQLLDKVEHGKRHLDTVDPGGEGERLEHRGGGEGLHLFNHVKTTTAAVELWEDVIVLEQSGKHVLLVQSKRPHILHPTLEEKLVLSFAEVLPLDHPGGPEFEEHAALHGDVHVEGKMGSHHRGELLHSGKYLCACCLVVVVDTSVGLSLQVKCPRLDNNILPAMKDCVKHDRLSSMHFLTTCGDNNGRARAKLPTKISQRHSFLHLFANGGDGAVSFALKTDQVGRPEDDADQEEGRW